MRGADTWIVVVNWNGARVLSGCLAALSRQTRPAHVLVVDNGSSDGSASAAAAFAQAEWVPLGKNEGFSPASNLGMRRALAAGARWIALVNNDVEVEPDWLARLVEAAEAHPGAGFFGGMLLFRDDPGRVNSTGLVLDRFGRARDRDYGAAVEGVATRDGPVLGVTGGAVLIRAEALRRVGLFDPAYFAYYEDVDLALRAARAGVGSWYVSAARARHGYATTLGAGSPRHRYLLARNHVRFAATHLPLARAAAVAVGFTVLRAAVNVPVELARGRGAHAVAQLRAAVDGARAAAQGFTSRVRWRGGPPAGAEPALR